MDQDATWYGDRPRPMPHCARLGPSSASPKGSTAPIFGPCLLCSNGWMDQGAALYGGRPRPRPHRARRERIPLPKRGHSPRFSVHVCCVQTAGYIKMPLGTMVGLGTGNIVLDADPAPPKGAEAPKISAMSVVTKRLDGSGCHLVRR